MPAYHRYNEEVLSNDINEIISYKPHWFIRKGNLIFLALIMAFLSLSWFVKLDDTTRARMITASQDNSGIQIAALKQDTRNWKPGQQVFVKGQCWQSAGQATIGEIREMPGMPDSSIIGLNMQIPAGCVQTGGLDPGISMITNERLFYRIWRSE